MLQYSSSNSVYDLSEIASKSSNTAYQLQKYISGFGKRKKDSLRKGLIGGREICQFLLDSFDAALEKPVRFDKLALIAMLEHVQEDLEKTEEHGLEGLKDDAETALNALNSMMCSLEKGDVLPIGEAKTALAFFEKIIEPYLKASASILMQESS